MRSLGDIEDAVAQLPPAEFAAFRDWLEALVATRIGADVGETALLPRLSPVERAALIADAQERSRRLRDDPADRRLLDELIDLQAAEARMLGR